MLERYLNLSGYGLLFLDDGVNHITCVVCNFSLREVIRDYVKGDICKSCMGILDQNNKIMFRVNNNVIFFVS